MDFTNMILPIAFNLGHIFFQFSIVTYMLRIRVHWCITLAASIVISVIFFENPWLMIGVFYVSTTAYYFFVARMQLKPMILAVSMHFFLTSVVGSIFQLFFFAVNSYMNPSYTRLGALLIYIAMLLIIRRFKYNAEFLLRDKTIFTLSLTMMLVSLVSHLLQTFHMLLYSQMQEYDRASQILNSIWMLAVQATVIYIIVIFDRFAGEIEEHEQHRLYTDTLDKSLDIQRGQMHDHANIMNTLLGYSSLKKYDRMDEYIRNIVDESIFDITVDKINDKLRNHMPYLYGIIARATMESLGKVRLEVDITARYFKLETVTETQLSRMVGNLVDNALAAARQSTNKKARIEISNELGEKIRIKVINSVDEQVDTSDLYKRGVSNKEGHSGFGLYDIRSTVDKLGKEGLYVEFGISCTDEKFIADLLV